MQNNRDRKIKIKELFYHFFRCCLKFFYCLKNTQEAYVRCLHVDKVLEPDKSQMGGALWNSYFVVTQPC